MRVLLASAAVLWAIDASELRAQTLTDALIGAYQTSPLLESNRAALRSLDETVPQARSLRRPRVDATAGVRAITDVTEFPLDDLYSAALSASLLLYDNGATAAAIESARLGVASGRASLIGVEQDVLFNAVQAFMDVIQAIEFVRIARNDVRVLTEQVDATRNRFEVGEVTRTDVSQTEARLAASRGRLVNALGNLDFARSSYLAAVGTLPSDLSPPPPIPELPADLAAAEQLAVQLNPALISARFAERAALADFDRARAATGVSVQATSSFEYLGQYSLAPQGNDRFELNLGLGASLPLYTGGLNSSLIRQAQQVLDQRRFQVQDAARTVIELVNNSWTSLEIAQALIVANREQVVAAQIAFEGVSEEARLGARSTLDVLDADQERLTAEAEVVRAQRDEYVAAYAVLRSMGLLTVEHLDLGIDTYDPQNYFAAIQSAPVGGYDTSAVERIRARWEQP